MPAAGATEVACAEDDAAALTATVADGRLALAGWVPRRLRGRPLALPPAAELQSATHAKLNNAQLEGIPAALFSAALRRLAHLDLSYNAIRSLPSSEEAWATLEALEELNLSHNLLKVLPPALGGASALRRLNVRSNQLRGWHENCAAALAALPALVVLDVRYNPKLALDEAKVVAALPGARLGSEEEGGRPAVLIGAEAGVPIRRGSALARSFAGDGPGASWPPLLAQLAPLPTPAVLSRLHDTFGVGSGDADADYAALAQAATRSSTASSTRTLPPPRRSSRPSSTRRAAGARCAAARRCSTRR